VLLACLSGSPLADPKARATIRRMVDYTILHPALASLAPPDGVGAPHCLPASVAFQLLSDILVSSKAFVGRLCGECVSEGIRTF